MSSCQAVSSPSKSQFGLCGTTSLWYQQTLGCIPSLKEQCQILCKAARMESGQMNYVRFGCQQLRCKLTRICEEVGNNSSEGEERLEWIKRGYFYIISYKLIKRRGKVNRPDFMGKEKNECSWILDARIVTDGLLWKPTMLAYPKHKIMVPKFKLQITNRVEVYFYRWWMANWLDRSLFNSNILFIKILVNFAIG